MLTLLIRSDKPEAELYLYKGSKKVAEKVWEAHRQLADTLHISIESLLVEAGYSLNDVERIGVYEGPGSFTGLRIGMTVANSLGYSLNIPVAQAGGELWIVECLKSTETAFQPASPIYGSDPHITSPKK